MNEKSRLFIGIECEGESVGLSPCEAPRTLFIPAQCNCTALTILGIATRYQLCRFYFGAGGSRMIPEAHVRIMEILLRCDHLAFELKRPRLTIVAEIDKVYLSPMLEMLPTELMQSNQFELVVVQHIPKPKGEILPRMSMKLENDENVFWFGPTRAFVTSMSDDRYTNDSYIDMEEFK